MLFALIDAKLIRFQRKSELQNKRRGVGQSAVLKAKDRIGVEKHKEWLFLPSILTICPYRPSGEVPEEPKSRPGKPHGRLCGGYNMDETLGISRLSESKKKSTLSIKERVLLWWSIGGSNP